MRRRPLSKWIASLNNLSCDLCCPIQSYPSFPTVILVLEAGYLRVTHPFAMVLLPFDLHVLGTPPALILSQDQTLQKIYLLFCFFSFLLLFFFRIALLFASSFFISSYTVFKDLNSCHFLSATPIYYYFIFFLSTFIFTFLFTFFKTVNVWNKFIKI